MDRIPITRIVEITKDKIYYRDDRGDIGFIELEPCANLYETVHGIANQPDRKVRCIGVRFFGEYAYYELYTVGHIQIYMNLKTNIFQKAISKIFGLNFHTKHFQQFYSIQKQLNEKGWTTLDLS
ncbi:MAG: hypothetical protein J6M34_02700 [Clostridia bacterium]|nr:hypothetical protein [Clostridia bacterium]